MHKNLQECIESAKKARDGVLDKSMTVKEANAISNANHGIISCHAIDLRERIFAAETATPALPKQLENTATQPLAQ